MRTKTKVLVLSDTHGAVNRAESAIERENDADMLVFAGDMQRDIEAIMRSHPRLPCVYVLGNNDWFVHDVPYDRTFTLFNKKFFLTHGHKYGVKGGLLSLKLKAAELGADVCIFGHTHMSFCETRDGILMLNPGTAYLSYGVIEVNSDGNINAEIKSF